MKNALLRRRLDDFGDLLHCAWQAKRQMSYKISNAMIDELYEVAQKSGALGGKITGAGGGGYILFYCDFDRKHKVAHAMRNMGASPVDFAFEAHGLQTWRIHDSGSSN